MCVLRPGTGKLQSGSAGLDLRIGTCGPVPRSHKPYKVAGPRLSRRIYPPITFTDVVNSLTGQPGAAVVTAVTPTFGNALTSVQTTATQGSFLTGANLATTSGNAVTNVTATTSAVGVINNGTTVNTVATIPPGVFSKPVSRTS
jgi:hypothetical protein